MCTVVPVLLLSEMYLSRDRLSFTIFTDNRRRKRQVSVRSSSQQGEHERTTLAGTITGARLPRAFGGANTAYPYILGLLPRGGGRSTETLTWDQFHALCKRLPGGDHEPVIDTLIAVGDASVFASLHHQLRP